VTAFLARSLYERAPLARGWRNGVRPRRVQTGEGELVVEVPQLTGTVERFVCRIISGTTTVIRTLPGGVGQSATMCAASPTATGRANSYNNRHLAHTLGGNRPRIISRSCLLPRDAGGRPIRAEA
jgi:hypothetical protein